MFRDLESSRRPKIFFPLSISISVLSIVSICLLQLDSYNQNYIPRFDIFCTTHLNSQIKIDYFSSSISICLILVYMVMHKRQTLFRKKFKFKYIGIPMIISCWSKTKRLYPSLIYGIIALNVFEIYVNILNDSILEKDENYFNFEDPTGLISLIIGSIEIFFLSLKYFPLLVAIRANSFLICLTSTLYLSIDFLRNIYVYGKCSENNEIIISFIYQILIITPFSILCSITLVQLSFKTYQLCKCKIDIKFYKKKGEMILSEHDFNYVSNILSNKNFQKVEKSSFKNFFKKFIYNWNDHFKFTSRFINTIIIAILTLYFFFIFFSITVINDSKFFLFEAYKLVFGIILAEKFTNLSQSIKSINLTEEYNFDYDLKVVCIAPISISMIICILHLFFFVRECQKNLLASYKGKCELIKSNTKISNGSIAESSFKFTGLLIGYLLFGFLAIYITLSLTWFILLIIRYKIETILKEEVRALLIKKTSQFVFVLIGEIIINILIKRLFLARNTKIIALDNFRIYNILIFISFFFNCFMGFFACLLRFFKSILISLLMMPRISYGFIGRLMENYDDAFLSYCGFLHMESMHSNPILITFCSIFYYKDLMNLRLDKFGQNSKSLNKVYNRKVLNRWHLYLRLWLNKELIQYRKKL